PRGSLCEGPAAARHAGHWLSLRRHRGDRALSGPRLRCGWSVDLHHHLYQLDHHLELDDVFDGPTAQHHLLLDLDDVAGPAEHHHHHLLLLLDLDLDHDHHDDDVLDDHRAVDHQLVHDHDERVSSDDVVDDHDHDRDDLGEHDDDDLGHHAHVRSIWRDRAPRRLLGPAPDRGRGHLPAPPAP